MVLIKEKKTSTTFIPTGYVIPVINPCYTLGGSMDKKISFR